MSIAALLVAVALPAAPTQHTLKAELGAFSPVGVAGITYAADLTKHLQLEAGVGVQWGLQFSVMPHFVLDLSAPNDATQHRMLFGAGLSAGLVDLTGGWSLPAFVEAKSNTLWLNVDAIGYEARFDSGLVLGIAGGATIGLTGRFSSNFEGITQGQEEFAVPCEGGSRGCYEYSTRGLVTPHLRVSAGYHF